MSKQKVILITGASSGIGEACAKRLVQDGHKLVLTARSEDKLSALQTELGQDNVEVVAADATDIAALKQVVERGIERFGQLDVAFANAGMGVSSPGTENGDVEEWDSMIDINIRALLYTAKLTLPHLRKTKGHFITTSSAAGRRALKGSVYGATKYFAYGFSMNLGEEMAEWGGRSTAICPGMVNTPFFDEAKPDKLDPADVADAVAFAVNADHRNTIKEIFFKPTHYASPVTLDYK